MEHIILILTIAIVSLFLYKSFEHTIEKEVPVKVMKCAPGKCGAM